MIQSNLACTHGELLKKVELDINNKSLKADQIIQELFSITTIIDKDTVYEAALKRSNIGNPPGKKGSLGDALNWECLLATVPEGNNIYFITDDKDFYTPLGLGDEFNQFLLSEWKSRKKSDLLFYKRISSFFKDHFPNITLASELEKDLLINDLAKSPSFSHTHILIKKLSRYTNFSSVQINDIVEAYITNDQIYRILSDDDVHQFIYKIIEGNVDKINTDNYKELLDDLESALPKEAYEDPNPF